MLKSATIFLDGSDACAVVETKNCIVSFNFINNKVVEHWIKTPKCFGNRATGKRNSELKKARQVFDSEIFSKLTPEWLARHQACYSE